jgi:hypothetical protein
MMMAAGYEYNRQDKHGSREAPVSFLRRFLEGVVLTLVRKTGWAMRMFETAGVK